MMKSNYDIMRENYLFDMKRMYLRDLFYQMDTNGDRVVSKEEIMNYMINTLQMDIDTAKDSTDVIFKEIDENNDEFLQIDEFADNYIEIVRKVRAKQIGYEDQMIDGYEEFKYYTKIIKQKKLKND